MNNNNIIKPHDERFTMVANQAVNSNMSLKAKGLLLVICEKSPNWQFSIEGLCAICQEGREAIRSAVKELKNNGFVYFEETRDEKGQFMTVWHVKSAGFEEKGVKAQVAPTTGYPYTGEPTTGEPTTGEPTTGEPTTDNPTQLYNKEHKTKEHKTNNTREREPQKKSPPSLSEVTEYCTERKSCIDPEMFWNYYEAIGWERNGQPIVNWHALVATWEAREEEPIVWDTPQSAYADDKGTPNGWTRLQWLEHKERIYTIQADEQYELDMLRFEA